MPKNKKKKILAALRLHELEKKFKTLDANVTDKTRRVDISYSLIVKFDFHEIDETRKPKQGTTSTYWCKYNTPNLIGFTALVKFLLFYFIFIFRTLYYEKPKMR